MPRSRALGRIAILLASFGAAARAQERGETIEVVGDRPSGSPGAPAAESSSLELSEFGGEVRSAAELLATLPGATVHALGGPGQAATVSLRGASADESLVLLDGIPLQGPGGGAVDLATVPATLLERLVVSRGVLGGQFGAGALGGAIELMPRSAGRKLAAGAQVGAGSFGTAQGAFDLSGPVSQGGNALFALQGDRTNGRFEYARQLTPGLPGAPYYGFTRENADAARGAALLRVAQQIASGTELDVLAQGSAGARGLPGSANATTTKPREVDAGGMAGARLRGSAGEALWSVRAYSRLDRLELRGVQRFQECDDGAPGCPRLEQFSSSARGEAELFLPWGTSQVLGGSLSLGEEWVRGTQTGPHRRALASALLREDFAKTAAFSLHPALRLDSVGSETGLSPALTARARPFGIPFDLRAGWGLSFRPPSMSELYLNRGGIEANPALRSERAWSVDAGASWHQRGLLLSAAVFLSSYRDLIIYLLHPSANAVTPSNVGSALVSGLELQAIVPLPAAFALEATYSFLAATNRAAGEQHGQQLAYRPPHRLFLRLARHGERVEGYGEASFVSAMPRNEFGVTQAAQLVLNGGLGVRVAGPLWLDLEVKNLLDDQTLEDLFQYPLPGRSIAVIARARL